MIATASFLESRDFLLAKRADYEGARKGFVWPRMPDFNWALDYFDPMAVGNENPALWIVEESGEECRLSFAALAARSNQVANWLRAQGVRRGDRLLLMLGNEVALWEVMLAAIKLGVVLIPTAGLLARDDLRDRITRGDVRHVVTGSANAAKVDALGGDFTRIAVGEPTPGWLDFAQSSRFPATFTPDARTRAADPLLLYFTSGTTAKPKLVLHTHQSYPVGHLSTMYWIGLRPGDIHLNISSPGWAKHAWSCFFAPWNAGACVFIYNYARFDAKAMLAVLERCRVTTLCAPPTVWRMLIQEDLAAFRGRLAIRELIGAGEPLNPEIIDRVQAAWGITVRDGFGQTETTAVVGNSPGQPVKAGSMGRPLPGYDVVLLDADGSPADEGEVSIRFDPRPVGLMDGYSGDPAEAIAPAGDIFYRTGDVARRDNEGYLWYIGRADDVFKSSDYRISPFKLESVAHRTSGDRRGGGRAQPRSPASRGTEVLRSPQSGLQRDARARRRHLRAPAPTAGPVRAHSSTRVRRHSEDDLGKDPARRNFAGSKRNDAQPTRKARSNSSKTRRRARSSTGPSSTCRWTPSISGTPISA